jgi:hypothetical protein
MSCSWWRIPIHSGPLLGSTALPLLSNLPSPPPTPWPILYYKDNINNLGLLDLEHLGHVKPLGTKRVFTKDDRPKRMASSENAQTFTLAGL